VPKRIVLCCWGSYGDLFPYLGLAARLKHLGHSPTLATSKYYRPMVEREGVGFHAVRPDIDPLDSETIARVMDPMRGTEVIVRELLVPLVRDGFRDLAGVVSDADLVVSHPVTFAAPLAAEAMRVPWLSTVLAPTSFFSVHDFPLLPPYPRLLHVARTAPWAARAFMRLARRITGPWTEPVRAFRRELGLREAGDPLRRTVLAVGTVALFSRYSVHLNRTGRADHGHRIRVSSDRQRSH
jgi:UDP:flavonoid glycosyltransferase YjiC (YdhE family)